MKHLRDRETCCILVALLSMHVLLALGAFEPALHGGGDNAAYFALAKSLVSGQGYRDLYDPALPFHTLYPPVFPAMLAALLALGFHPWVPFKLMVLVCSAGAIAFSYVWMRRRSRAPELAFGVAVLMAVSPGVIALSHQELSDVPFWAFTMAALLVWDRLDRGNTWRLVAASVLTLLAYFTRSAGLPLVFAVVLWLMVRKRWTQLAIFATIAFPVAFLWWWRARLLGSADYLHYFWFIDPYSPEVGRIDALGLLRRAKDSGSHYWQTHLPVLLIGTADRIGVLLGTITGALAIVGWVRRLRHARVAEFFLPLYVGLLLIWPAVWSGERLLVPALPLILFYSAEGFLRLLSRMPRSRVRLLSYSVVLVVVMLATPALVGTLRWGSMCTRTYLGGDRYACYSDEWRDFFQLAEMSGRILPQDSVVLSRKPSMFWALSHGVPSRSYPLSASPAALLDAAHKARAQYIVVDRLDRLSEVYLVPALRQRPAAFCVVYTLGPDRAAMLGVKAGAVMTPDFTQSSEHDFEVCGADYWRSAEIMKAFDARPAMTSAWPVPRKPDSQ